MSSETNRQNWALEQCASKGLRMTEARRRVIAFLGAHHGPVNLEQIGSAPEMAGVCDQATLWRTMTTLEEIGVVRRVSLKSKMAHYALATPEEHHDYLVCQDCGTVSELPHTKTLDTLQREIAKTKGFRFDRHEVEIYGTCPDCQDEPK
jgi:Fe2+ or Zn2+ uptake regulation protein